MRIQLNTQEPDYMRIWGSRMQARTCEPQDIRMWGCQQAHMNFIEYEDASMCGCQKAHIRPKLWEYEDAKIQASTHEPEDMRI